jgi:hypothetical protein
VTKLLFYLSAKRKIKADTLKRYRRDTKAEEAMEGKLFDESSLVLFPNSPTLAE